MGIILYQELPHLQELGVRLICPALIKCWLIMTALDGAGGALAVPVNTGWKELEGEPRAVAPRRVQPPALA